MNDIDKIINKVNIEFDNLDGKSKKYLKLCIGHLQNYKKLQMLPTDRIKYNKLYRFINENQTLISQGNIDRILIEIKQLHPEEYYTYNYISEFLNNFNKD